MDAQADYTLKLSWAISKLVQRKWRKKSEFTHWRWFRAFAFIHAAATICKSAGWRGACLKVVKGDTVHLTITEERIDMHALDFNASNIKKKQFPGETHTASPSFWSALYRRSLWWRWEWMTKGLGSSVGHWLSGISLCTSICTSTWTRKVLAETRLKLSLSPTSQEWHIEIHASAWTIMVIKGKFCRHIAVPAYINYMELQKRMWTTVQKKEHYSQQNGWSAFRGWHECKKRK